MGARFPDPRRIKLHHAYSVQELAHRLGVHKQTVRNWRKAGLQPIDETRPILFKGEAIKAFLAERRARVKRPCGPGELFCLPCRAPRRPAGDMVDIVPITAKSGNMSGICPVCDRLIYRRVPFDRIELVAAGLEVNVTQAQETLGEVRIPSVTCHSSVGGSRP